MTLACDREARIAEYARRAAAGLPLFGGRRRRWRPERPACWACGAAVRVSRWTLGTFVSRPFDNGVESETYCAACFGEHGWPEMFGWNPAGATSGRGRRDETAE